MKTSLKIITFLLGLAALVACDPVSPLAPWAPPPTSATTHRVVLFGDSLSVDAKNEAVATWTTDPATAVSYNSFGGTRVDHWLDEMRSVPAGACAVVALGTNDLGDGAVSYDQARWNVLEALNVLRDRGARRVTWVTVSTYSAGLRGAADLNRTRAWDTWLRDLTASGQYPNLRLEEWDLASRDHPEYLRSDLVHHVQAGQDAYAATLVHAAVC